MSSNAVIFSILIVILSNFSVQASAAGDGCGAAGAGGSCVDEKKAFSLKIIAVASILITSMIGVCSPLVTSAVPALSPDRNLFVVVKSFAAGIILATGFMHVLPDAFDMLSSECLQEHPWHEFPFTGFVAMFSALVTLMIDSVATSLYSEEHREGVRSKSGGDREMAAVEAGGAGHSHFHGHHHHGATKLEAEGSKIHRYRVIAMVLELGIIVHSVVIGLSLGASNNSCSIKGLIAALCFHQMFEGMGLGGCILQAEYRFIKKAAMVFFFSVTTPLGIVLGMAIAKSYNDNSPRALITEGLLNASSAGLLIYMALVDLLAADFMGTKLQSDIMLQIKSLVAVFLGAGGMSVMAIWA